MEKANEQQMTATIESVSRRRDWWQWLVLATLIVLLYYEILARLVRQWIQDPNFSHGFFVPAFSAFVVWNERKRLAQLEERPSWWGVVNVALALCVLVLGVLGAELFLSRCSLVLLLAGLLIQFRGWTWFRALLFPWAFLFLMIPIPVIIFNQIAFPLQLLASQLASSTLALLGVPVLREGNVLHLPVMSLEVVEACSGIRSLMSLGTMAIIYGYFLEPGIWRRVLLAIGAIPIAVAANALRIVGTGLLGEYWDPNKALGFFHTFSGWLIFVMSLALLFGLHGLLRTGERWLTARRERATR
jgi:exosortase